MNLARKMFVAGVFSLLVASLTGHSRSTANSLLSVQEEIPVTTKFVEEVQACINEALKGTGLTVTVTSEKDENGKDVLSIIPSGRGSEIFDCRIADAITNCTLAKGIPFKVVETKAISSGGAGSNVLMSYKGHRGTATDTDFRLLLCTNIPKLVDLGTVKIDTNQVEKIVTTEAQKLGIKVDNLKVEVKKNDRTSYIQIKGRVMQPKDRAIITALVRKYTGFNNIKIDMLRAVQSR